MKNNIKKIALICSTILIGFACEAQTKVLFLGNSFTYMYDVPTLFAGLASSAGISVFVDENTQAGMAVANESIIGHASDATSQAKIVSQDWDYIVVQDNQGNYVNSVGYLPSACGNANVTLYNQIKANNPCTRIIYLAEWGPVGGVFSGDNTVNCINRIHGNMLYLNDNIGNEIVSPVGKSWITSFTSLPSVNLYYSDNVHPSLEGCYLTAATVFTTIFKYNPTTLTYTGGVSSSTASTMRSIAYSTVTNPSYLTATDLSMYTPTISVSGNVLTASGTYSDYQWYFNGSPVGINSNTYTATASGMYQVEVTNASGCLMRSFTKDVTLVTTGIAESNLTEFELVSLTNNTFDLISKENGVVTIYDMQGKLLLSIEKADEHVLIDFSNNSEGIYLVTLINNNTKVCRKIMLSK